jgi:hypothetical protein
MKMKIEKPGHTVLGHTVPAVSACRPVGDGPAVWRGTCAGRACDTVSTRSVTAVARPARAHRQMRCGGGGGASIVGAAVTRLTGWWQRGLTRAVGRW